VPNHHYLITIIQKDAYMDALARPSALRNFAAHESTLSKRSSLAASGGQRIEIARRVFNFRKEPSPRRRGGKMRKG
jgi:hypothetical protein